MSREILVLLVLLVVLIGALPNWPYNQTWGYYPSLLVIVLAAAFIVKIMLYPDSSRSFVRDTKAAVQDMGQDVKRDMRNAADRIRSTVDR